MLKVAIVGCGKIADSHASQIQRIEGCEIVGVCDREPLMAQQLAQRFQVKRHFSDVNELLNETRPDAVHITTPPQSHFELGKLCMLRGCHIYVEKPFTVTTKEAEALIAIADEHGRKMTAGHDDQFRHAARRMRQMIQDGYLGGNPLHMESYYGYEFGQSGYAKAILADKQHWVRKLPGGILQNVISHGVARIAEFLVMDNPQVIAHGFVSPNLRKLGETQLVDELRVIISEQGGVTAYFTFSAQMRPSLHQFRVFGSQNALLMDQDNETLIKLRGARHKSYLEQFVPPVSFARQYFQNLKYNVGRFLAKDFQAKAGMKYLIESFYGAITKGAPLPISYREILLTSRIMESIFEQLSACSLSENQTETGKPASETVERRSRIMA